MNTNLSSKDILELAISKHKTQDLLEAEKLYQEVLNKDDKNFNANFLLGTLFASTKRFELALTKLEKAKARILPAVLVVFGITIVYFQI